MGHDFFDELKAGGIFFFFDELKGGRRGVCLFVFLFFFVSVCVFFFKVGVNPSLKNVASYGSHYY